MTRRHVAATKFVWHRWYPQKGVKHADKCRRNKIRIFALGKCWGLVSGLFSSVVPFPSVKGNGKIGSPNKYNGLYDSSTLKLVKSGMKYPIKGF